MPPNIPGSKAPLVAGMLSHPVALYVAPATTLFLAEKNRQVLEWAKANGKTLEDASVSDVTGLITFPGLGDTDPIPLAVQPSELGQVNSEEKRL